MAGNKFTITAAILAFASVFASTAAVGVYEHYTAGGIKSGLRAENQSFYLNNRKLVIHSGALHYFRVHPQYWRDRLRKLRANGLLAVETVIPWNLHEPYQGVFDFGDGGDDWSPFVDLQRFLKITKEEDLLAIIRPSPYMCGEWEFGGFPSWILRDRKMKVRTNDPNFMTAIKKYFAKLLPILRDNQFINGGPVIAFQIENEYGHTQQPGQETDKKYLAALKKIYESYNLTELYFTADSVGRRFAGAVPGVFMTANLGDSATRDLTALKSWQPDKPSMVMEYYGGWYDHWAQRHHVRSLEVYLKNLEEILKFPASVNQYMFHGGTSFGFLNGANLEQWYPYYLPDTTSYDYDAPLTEAGDYTPKYHASKKLFAAYQPLNLTNPELPPELPKEKYETLRAAGILNWNSIIERIPADEKQKSLLTTYMEFLDVNNKNGQSYGYISYRTNVKPIKDDKVELTISDVLKYNLMVIVDGKRVTAPLRKLDDVKGFGYWIVRNGTMSVPVKSSGSVVDIVVENWGRNNFGYLYQFDQTIGLAPRQVVIDKKIAENWEISSLQFKGKWVRSLKGWNPAPKNESLSGPLLLRFDLNIKDQPKDTFLDMRGWGKGVVFVNGFNVGRFCSLGPVYTLYVPAPLLKSGVNEIVVFEHFDVPKNKEGVVVLNFSKGHIF